MEFVLLKASIANVSGVDVLVRVSDILRVQAAVNRDGSINNDCCEVYLASRPDPLLVQMSLSMVQARLSGRVL